MFKVGDKVIDRQYGMGKVVEINDILMFPVMVSFLFANKAENYNQDGYKTYKLDIVELELYSENCNV